MNVVPVTSAGRPLITAFGAGGFRFGLQSGDLRIEDGVLILADQPEPWSVGQIGALDERSVQPILAYAGQVEFVLFGTGEQLESLPRAMRALFQDHGLGLEVMTTQNACRAYNHLASEGRHFAAALLPVGAAIG